MIKTFTVKGKNTADNRDVVIHFSHFDVTIFLVLDGATSCPAGGDFSRELAFEVKKRFQDIPKFDLHNELVKKS